MKELTSQNAVKELLEERKMPKAALAKKLGKTNSTIVDSLNKSKGMSVDKFVEYMTAMGYEVVVRDTISGKDACRIGRDDEQNLLGVKKEAE